MARTRDKHKRFNVDLLPSTLLLNYGNL